MLNPGAAIPNFSLTDQDGQLHSSDEYQGKWLVLYFYPKDDTPGCTAEACSFRDDYDEYAKRGVAVVGISKDSVKSHKKFQEKYHLPFTLLSDETKETIQAFGAWAPKKFMGKEYMGTLRTTFLINPAGTIEKVYENVTPAGHAAKILADIPSH